jgi:hypothetical protein
MTDPSRVRRNIDNLSADELANYQHAFKTVKDISESDPNSVDGYTYYEQMHDGSNGPCEHKNDTFLPWHRGHLYLFEEALRRSDRPRTQNVTIPYWDWSALPSGKRYPNAFEDQGSILFDDSRNTDPICRTNGQGSCERLPFPRQQLEDVTLAKSAWSAPVPMDSLTSFGGHAGGQQDCSSQFSGKGFGALEQPPHNTMHGEYVGGNIADPASAALDPLFWSFHCYIDLLWSQWQEKHQVDTDLDARLCGVFTDRNDPHNPKTWMRVKDVLTTAALGYSYEWKPGEPPPARFTLAAGPLFPTHPAVDFAVSARKQPEIVRTLNLTIPEPGFQAARLIFTGVNAGPSFSYGADIYLTPQDEEFRPHERDFRDSYLADMLYFWKAHHHGAHGGHSTHGEQRFDMVVDLSRALASLADKRPGGEWRVSVALTASDSKSRPHHVDHGARLAAAPMPTDRADVMNFGELTLRVY